MHLDHMPLEIDTFFASKKGNVNNNGNKILKTDCDKVVTNI